MSRRIALVAAGLSIALGLGSPGTQAAPNLIVNPTFTGITVFAGGPGGTTAGGWTFINCGGAYAGSGAEGGYVNACGSFGNAGTIEQAVSTVAGALYHVSFFLTANGVITLNTIDVRFGGTTGYSATEPALPVTPTYEEFSFDADATDATTLFAFDGTFPGGGTIWIDNVSVVQETHQSVPEPGTLTIIAGSLLGLAAVRRRTRT